MQLTQHLPTGGPALCISALHIRPSKPPFRDTTQNPFAHAGRVGVQRSPELGITWMYATGMIHSHIIWMHSRGCSSIQEKRTHVGRRHARASVMHRPIAIRCRLLADQRRRLIHSPHSGHPKPQPEVAHSHGTALCRLHLPTPLPTPGESQINEAVPVQCSRPCSAQAKALLMLGLPLRLGRDLGSCATVVTRHSCGGTPSCALRRTRETATHVLLSDFALQLAGAPENQSPTCIPCQSTTLRGRLQDVTVQSLGIGTCRTCRSSTGTEQTSGNYIWYCISNGNCPAPELKQIAPQRTPPPPCPRTSDV